jgi:dTDP-4-amino-4,6-dideoxygalactose transaminase
MLRNYGQRRKYDHAISGHNRRLDTIQAAALRPKLERLDEWNEQRRASAARYLEALADADVGLPVTRPGVEHVWHLFVVRSSDRDGLQAHLAEQGISTGIHYPIPVHLLDACSALGYREGDFPTTEQLAAEILSLPMYPGLTEDEVDRVAEEVLRFSRRDVVRRRAQSPETGARAAV